MNRVECINFIKKFFKIALNMQTDNEYEALFDMIFSIEIYGFKYRWPTKQIVNRYINRVHRIHSK